MEAAISSRLLDRYDNYDEEDIDQGLWDYVYSPKTNGSIQQVNESDTGMSVSPSKVKK